MDSKEEFSLSRAMGMEERGMKDIPMFKDLFAMPEMSIGKATIYTI